MYQYNSVCPVSGVMVPQEEYLAGSPATICDSIPQLSSPLTIQKKPEREREREREITQCVHMQEKMYFSAHSVRMK